MSYVKKGTYLLAVYYGDTWVASCLTYTTTDKARRAAIKLRSSSEYRSLPFRPLVRIWSEAAWNKIKSDWRITTREIKKNKQQNQNIHMLKYLTEPQTLLGLKLKEAGL